MRKGTVMQTYGPMNGHIIGIAMKEMVRRAIVAIRGQRFIFEVTAKRGYDGEMDDLVTSADKAAQKIYVKLIREMFPTFGILAEEDALRVPCTADPALGDIYFTVDSLDGTRAYKRRQSDSIGTMLALVVDGKVIASCIGDVMTQEIYYYRPGSEDVHRLSEFEHPERLLPPHGRQLSDLYIQLRERPEVYASPLFRSLIAPQDQGGAFDDIGIIGGSIGIGMARLWKGEMGAMLLHTKFATPWDVAPVVGICRKLGYVFLEPNEDHSDFVEVQQEIAKTILVVNRDSLVIHECLLPQLQDWLRQRRG